MIAPIYQLAAPSDAVQAAMVASWRAMNIKEGWLCSKGYPQPQGGVKYDDNLMKGVQYVADEGGCAWIDVRDGKSKTHDDSQFALDIDMTETPRETDARIVADALGYESVSNCAAMWRDTLKHDLCRSTIIDGCGWIMATDYGLEQLLRWEEFRD